MQKLLIVAGLIAVTVGLAWPMIIKLPFGRLPGDIIISRPGMKVYVPITTMIIVSLIVSLLVRGFKK